MKVAVIIDTWFPFVGGGQINAWEISKRIAQRGIEIEIITPNNGPDDLPKVKNLKVVKLGNRSDPGSLLAQLIFVAQACFFVLKRDYDLIHAHAFLPGLTAWFLMFFKRIPAVFTVHGTSLGTGLNNPVSAAIEGLILTKIRYNAQITVSRDFLNLKNVNKDIVYIKNGVDVAKFEKVKASKFPDPTLIFVGRLHKQKNLPILLHSIKSLTSDLPNLKLLIAGEGLEKPKIEKIIKKLGLRKFVKLLGEVKGVDLVRLYKASHIFILPSIYEGQPLTLLEAWAAKLPLVVSKTGDCQYLVKDGYNGYLIKNPRDPSEITRVIKKALSNQNLEKLSQAGYNLVRQQFSWEMSAAKTLQVYKNVIKSQN